MPNEIKISGTFTARLVAWLRGKPKQVATTLAAVPDVTAAERGRAMLSEDGIRILQGSSRAKAVKDGDEYLIYMRHNGYWLHVGWAKSIEEAVSCDDCWYSYQRREFELSRT